MSWQAYVDTNLIGTTKVTNAAIIGLKGGVWATSAGFNILPAEEAALLTAHVNQETTQSSGIRLAKVKYFTISVDERTIIGKKGQDGCVIVKTKQALLVATYVDPIQAAECSKIVQGLGDYLINLNY